MSYGYCMDSHNICTVAECEDLKVKYNEEQAKRKKLFNEVQEAKGMCFFFWLSIAVML